MMSANSRTWDCIVVGAGVVGSSTAYQLTKNGCKTLVLEQFSLPHSRGSSHGQSRIIRKLYTNPTYAAMMPEAYDLWEQIAKEAGRDLYRRTGMLMVEDASGPSIPKTKAAMDRYNLPNEQLSHGDLCKRYPLFHYPPTFRGLFDPTSGLLRADRCLFALWELIKKQGGDIRDCEKVQSISTSATGVVLVTTDTGSYSAKKVVLALGPWTKDLLSKTGLPDLPLKTMPGRPAFFRDTTNGKYSADQGLPITSFHFDKDDNDYRFYAFFPSLEYPGLVKAVTRGEPPPRYSHPDERDLDDKNELGGLLSTFVQKYVPGLYHRPCLMEAAVYTMTPDKGYIIDHHPNNKNILVAAGFSGHGFKLAPVVGKLLCQMVRGEPTSYDMNPFRISRFQKSKL